MASIDFFTGVVVPDSVHDGNPQPQSPASRLFQCDTQPYVWADHDAGPAAYAFFCVMHHQSGFLI